MEGVFFRLAVFLALVAMTAATSLRRTEGNTELVTIVNNCEGMDGYIPYASSISGTAPVPSECIGESKSCSLYTGDNPAFFLAPEGNVAAVSNGHTRAELNLNLAGSGSWINISKVAGFNAGLAIDVKGQPGQSQVCNDVNCKDSYLLCDTANLAVHNPVRRVPLNQHYVVTFCPNGRADTAPVKSVDDAFFASRAVEEGHAMYWCACGSGSDISLVTEGDMMLLSGSHCGPVPF